MSYTEDIIKDSRDRFGDRDWISIASDRIDAAYKKRGDNKIGEITNHSFTMFALSFIGKVFVAAIILMGLIYLQL